MKRIKICLVFLVLIFGAQNSLGQVNVNGSATHPLPQWVLDNENKRQREAEARNRANAEMISARKSIPAKVILRSKVALEERNKRLEEINQKLAVPVKYNNKFAEFLKIKNTGIARILPERNCGTGKIVDVKELERCADTADIPGAGSLYSVRLSDLPSYLPFDLIMFYIKQSDIHFIEDKFVVGNSSTQNIISDIGKVEFEAINLKSEPFKFLREYKPDRKITEIKLQRQVLEKGINENGYFYSTSAPIKLDNTYVMRSIAYSPFAKRNFWHTDILVAFKIVGQEADGSIVILWKKLKQKDAPVLKEK